VICYDERQQAERLCAGGAGPYRWVLLFKPDADEFHALMTAGGLRSKLILQMS
jgi:hypothetical protein